MSPKTSPGTDGPPKPQDAIKPVSLRKRLLISVIVFLNLMLVVVLLESSASPFHGNGQRYLRRTEPFRTILEWIGPPPRGGLGGGKK